MYIWLAEFAVRALLLKSGTYSCIDGLTSSKMHLMNLQVNLCPRCKGPGKQHKFLLHF